MATLMIALALVVPGCAGEYPTVVDTYQPAIIRPEMDWEIVREYGLDPIFCQAVAVVESGWRHDSYQARVHNNLFGIHGKSFQSKNDCIRYWGRLMSGKLYRGKTIEEIAPIYCPPNAAKWAEMVRSVMRRLKGENQ